GPLCQFIRNHSPGDGDGASPPHPGTRCVQTGGPGGPTKKRGGDGRLPRSLGKPGRTDPYPGTSYSSVSHYAPGERFGRQGNVGTGDRFPAETSSLSRETGSPTGKKLSGEKSAPAPVPGDRNRSGDQIRPPRKNIGCGTVY